MVSVSMLPGKYMSFIIEYIESTRESHRFNGKFVHILYGDAQKICRRIKTSIFLFS
jgi:hypothetical protein